MIAIGAQLTDDTDWDEIGELVTESYRRLAPKKLTALLGQEAAAEGTPLPGRSVHSPE